MKKSGVRFAFVAALVLFAYFFLANLPASVQEQENVSQKTAPKPKTAPNQKAAPLQGSVREFKIGEFTVIVEVKPATAPGSVTTPGSKSQTGQAGSTTGTGYSGQGHIIIKGHNIRVSFSNIVVSQAKLGQIPIATSGTVQGQPGAAVEYSLDGFKIKLEPQSIKLMPNSATAAAGVSLVQAPFMAPGAANTLTLASETCALFPEGAVAGKNFRGSSAFLLRDSIYRLRIEPGVDQSVQLHKPVASPGQPRPTAEGVIAHGIASTTDNIDVFNYNGTIDSSGKSARLDLSLVTTHSQSMPESGYQTVPEPGYVLLLKSGRVNYDYGHDGTLNCAGEFNAQLTLPETVMGQDSRRIVLDNIVLKTDETGALFNALTISARFRVGFNDSRRPDQAVFLIEPSPDSVFVYFAKWQAPQNSTYTLPMTDQKKGPDCKALVDFLEHGATSATQSHAGVPKGKAQQRAPVPVPKSQVQQKAPIASPNVTAAPRFVQSTALRQNDKAKEKNVYGRPGLTIIQGTLHMKSPQASSPGTGALLAGEFNLKTRVWGLVTATPWGMTGTMTSSGCSFIPDSPDHSLDECSAPSGTGQPSWEEILQFQESDPKGQPPQKKERFRLSDLRVLEMRLTLLNICLNAVPEKGVTMSSIVHFPFPSYIDIDFVDQSLDDKGFFHTALGPVAPVATPPSAPPDPAPGQDEPALDPSVNSGTLHGPSLTPEESAAPRAGSQVRIGPMVKAKVPMEIPQTRILWVWRLPITLTGRGVTITFPQGRGPAAVQVVMNSATDESGNITSSEIWLKPLLSKRSTVKEGVRIEATLAPAGEFKLTRWDPNPVLCRTYPSPGTIPDNELKMGFACHLEGITLADAGPAFNTESRDHDFGWTGKVTLPLFKDQSVVFGVKKLEPFMPQKIDLQKTDCHYQTCPDPTKDLNIVIRGLGFSPLNYHFIGTDIRYRYPNSADNAEHAAASVEFSSFLTAFVLKDASGKKPWFDLTAVLAPGQSLTVHGLKDYVDGKGSIDVTCYDANALTLEGNLGLVIGCCRDNYFMGTYQVKQGDRIILSASNVRYYEGTTPITLYLGGTAMELTPEGDPGASGNKELLDIPGAELKMENGALYGKFDTASLPAFLPNVRGACAFTLDTRNAYFSVMIAGSFPITPFPINVEGETFFFHAPRIQLDPILVEAAGWALYADVDSMKKAIRMSDRDLSNSTVLSGALLSGNAAVVADFGPIEARIQRGAGLFFYQYKNEGGPTGYNYGVFQNNRARADVEFLSAEVVIDLTLAAQSTQGSFDSVKSYFQRSDLAFTGTISASACATCELAYARLDMKLDATYSVRGGVSWSGISPTASVGLGGCR